MLMDISSYLKERRGAIHVGGHDGEEREFYSTFNRAVYFEPNPELYVRLARNIFQYPNQIVFKFGIHDKLSNAQLNISSNDGQSSSILDLGLHKQYYPSISYVKKEWVSLERLDWFFKEGIIDSNNYNFLNIDVQGVELNVLKSCGKYITKFDYIYTEVNDQELYKGCCLVGDIDHYLHKHGFERVETQWTRKHWGDALYVRKDLITINPK